jgi:hypothetical protein
LGQESDDPIAQSPKSLMPQSPKARSTTHFRGGTEEVQVAVSQSVISKLVNRKNEKNRLLFVTHFTNTTTTSRFSLHLKEKLDYLPHSLWVFIGFVILWHLLHLEERRISQ